MNSLVKLLHVQTFDELHILWPQAEI